MKEVLDKTFHVCAEPMIMKLKGIWKLMRRDDFRIEREVALVLRYACTQPNILNVRGYRKRELPRLLFTTGGNMKRPVKDLLRAAK
jgi:hypothetical protein